MKMMIAAFTVLLLAPTARAEEKLTADQVTQKMLESDPWGFSGAEATAHVALKDKKGATSQLAFKVRSRRYEGQLSKALVRFSAPAEMAGAGFLLVQKKGGDDDDRFLYMPDLKKSRRIAGNLRTNAFMGTDFSFADLDRRDLRDGGFVLKGEENVDKFACYHLDGDIKRADSPYSRVELWVRKDNFLPIKWSLYDKAKKLQKTFAATEVKRVKGRWFISKSHMDNAADGHSTELVLDEVTPRDDIPDDEFTVRALEKN